MPYLPRRDQRLDHGPLRLGQVGLVRRALTHRSSAPQPSPLTSRNLPSPHELPKPKRQKTRSLPSESELGEGGGPVGNAGLLGLGEGDPARTDCGVQLGLHQILQAVDTLTARGSARVGGFDPQVARVVRVAAGRPPTAIVRPAPRRRTARGTARRRTPGVHPSTDSSTTGPGQEQVQIGPGYQPAGKRSPVGKEDPFESKSRAVRADSGLPRCSVR